MERQRLRELEAEAEIWAKTERIRAYLRAVEKEASARVDLEAVRGQLEEWVAWAKEHADNVDPVERLRLFGKPDAS
jgi:hypothetical protein